MASISVAVAGKDIVTITDCEREAVLLATLCAEIAEVCHGEGLRVVVQHFETEDAVSLYAESPPNHEEDAWIIAYDYCTCLFITCGRAGKRM
jgi:hypothetical protein